jgi:ribosome-associated protein
MRTVSLRPGEDSIRLGQLLKLVDAVPTGAQVKTCCSPAPSG